MGLEFRRRDYVAEEVAHSLSRLPATTHPLSSPPVQGNVVNHETDSFVDPLRATGEKLEVKDFQYEEITPETTFLKEASSSSMQKEWNSLKRTLMQRFQVPKTISISSTSNIIMKSRKASDKLSKDLHLEELEDPQKFVEEGIKLVTQKEYISRLHELKDEISSAWRTDDRVTSLKLSVRVAMLLMDTSVLQFYPTVFVLASEVMDLAGDLVWDRIRRKAEFNEDGTNFCSLPDNFRPGDICLDAKETCYNWFSRIGSVCELLPRIYLELALLQCWRFLFDHPVDCVQRLVKMVRGIADPLASAYCRLYLVKCAQRLPEHDKGYLVTCINDMKHLLLRIISPGGTTCGNHTGSTEILIHLIEPTIEYLMQSLFKETKEMQIPRIIMGLGMAENHLDLFRSCSSISIVLHHLLKELPAGIICSNALNILYLIQSSNDYSFNQCLNYKLLGFRLCERIPEVSQINDVLDKIIQVISCYDTLDEYLKVADAYLDIVLHNQMDAYLNDILDVIFGHICRTDITESELESLQSIFLKLIAYFGNTERILALNHFMDILDAMYGSSRNIVNTHILNMATRAGCIRDPVAIQFLFEVSQALVNGTEFSNLGNDENRQSVGLISRFVYMVDYGEDVERHLTFLIECRGAFDGISEVQEILVHISNRLTVKAMRDKNRTVSFVKSCLAFSEVSIPSIAACSRQFSLYLGSAEVALMSGLNSHSDGLIDSAISCLQDFGMIDGSRVTDDCDEMIALMCKLCSLIVLIPGSCELATASTPKHVLAFLQSQSWMLPRMKIKVLCALLLSSAASSQNQLLYPIAGGEVSCNGREFFCKPSSHQELSFFSGVLQNVPNIVLQESSLAVRGVLALEACNCIASSFTMCDETTSLCSKLVEIAKSCLGADNKYLQSTIKYLYRHRFLV